MDMNLQKYLSFVKTVEYGSFTRAAEILHYSQSGVSRMIGDLEKDWNMVLLERGKGGVRLTSNPGCICCRMPRNWWQTMRRCRCR